MLSATSLAARLTVFLIIAITLAVAVQMALSYRAIQRALYQDALATYRATTRDLAFRIARSADEGFPLAMLGNIQNIIDRQRAIDSAIMRILVTDRSGRAVFDTNIARIGQPVGSEWIPSDSDENRWVVEIPDGIVTGRRLTANGEDMGAVVVVQNRTDIEAQSTAILLYLIRGGVLTIIAGGLFAAGISYGLTRPLRRWSEAVKTGIEDALAGMAPGAVPVSSFEPNVANQIGAAAADLRSIENQLMRIGTGHGEEC